MLPPCHSYALTRRRFLPSKNRFAFICNTDFALQCKTFMVVRVLSDENDLLSSAIFPDQRAPYSSLESRIPSARCASLSWLVGDDICRRKRGGNIIHSKD
uniref:Uncharacterized protein n=1 Tax=Ixodes ricinus TaxID=34613 RepID=A0A0K8R5V0_IXORI